VDYKTELKVPKKKTLTEMEHQERLVSREFDLEEMCFGER